MMSSDRWLHLQSLLGVLETMTLVLDGGCATVDPCDYAQAINHTLPP